MVTPNLKQAAKFTSPGGCGGTPFFKPGEKYFWGGIKKFGFCLGGKTLEDTMRWYRPSTYHDTTVCTACTASVPIHGNGMIVGHTDGSSYMLYGWQVVEVVGLKNDWSTGQSYRPMDSLSGSLGISRSLLLIGRWSVE